MQFISSICLFPLHILHIKCDRWVVLFVTCLCWLLEIRIRRKAWFCIMTAIDVHGEERRIRTDGWWKRYRSLSCVYENLTYVSWVVRSNVITILLFWKCKVWWRTECCIECESPQYNWVLNVLVSLDRTRIGCFSLSRQSSGLAFSSHAQFFLFCPQEYHV